MKHIIFSTLFAAWRRPSGALRPRRYFRAACLSAKSAFSLIELMAVMAIVSVVAGISVPAVKGITGGNLVDASASKISGLLSLARSEAIAQHTIVRFVVATDWSGQEQGANFRKMSLWAWRAESESFVPLTNWEELPVGMILEGQLPAYVRGASYAVNDASTVRGSCVFDEAFATSAEFPAGNGRENISSRFIEFLPSGAARIPSSAERRAIFVATQGFANTGQPVTYTAQSDGQPTNWAQVNVDTLTGRVHVYRP